MNLASRISSRIKRSVQRPLDLPEQAWFDAPDAVEQIAQRSGGDASNERILSSWVEEGYAIVENVVPHDAIDAMLDELDDTFTAATALPGLEFCDLEFGTDGHRVTLDHGQLLERPVAERQAARERSNWRVHAFVEQSRAADNVRRNPELKRVASMILGYPTDASYSINFQNGSRQGLHQDTCVFHLGVPNLIVGAWIACEDIMEGSGPLVYYPGSHRGQLFPEFDDYPNTNLRTAPVAAKTRYNAAVAADAENFEEHRFMARKGDVLFWHGMLIHGGHQAIQQGLTRKSLVLHFVPRGADEAQNITLPPRA